MLYQNICFWNSYETTQSETKKNLLGMMDSIWVFLILQSKILFIWARCKMISNTKYRGSTIISRPIQKVIKLFSPSTQPIVSMEFILIINVKTPTIVFILTCISRINTTRIVRQEM